MVLVNGKVFKKVFLELRFGILHGWLMINV